MESVNDKKRLFSVAKTLLGKVKKSFLLDLGSDDIGNSCNDYFMNKTVVIHKDITKSATLSAVTEIKEKLISMSNLNKLSCFTPMTQDRVKRLVLNSSTTTCEHDPVTYILSQASC